MRLEYNIYFEVAAALFIFLLCFYTRQIYHADSKQNRMFLQMMIIVCLANVMDVITGVSISYNEIVPPMVNSVLSGIYLAGDGVLGYQFLKYALLYNARSGRRGVPNLFEKLVCGIYLGLLLINLMTGWIFTFDERGYVHGPIYLISYVVPYFFFILSSYYMVRSFGCMKKKQRWSIIFYILISVTGPFLQIFFFPDVLLTLFTISLGVVIILGSLETPEYQLLMDTMKELEQAKQEAQEANAAKSMFIANMSHEIRTPINAVLGMDEMIIRESEDQAISSYADNIQSAGNTLLSLVNDILDFSKIESGKMDLVNVSYEIKDVINDCLQMVSSRAEAKNLKINMECDPSTPRKLLGDEVRIRQILTNLLTNAVKYTKEGSVTLRMKWKPLEENSLQLLLSVEDTGIGISEENQKRLFDSFQRVDEKKNRNIEGTGLGLAITKQLVEQMDGTIGVYSELGKGSLFYVEIPQQILSQEPVGHIGQKDSGAKARDRYKESFVAPTARILVVDDVEMNLSVIRNLLKRTQIQLTTAMSGKEALALAKEQHFHLILMDDMMPEMDGTETLKALRNDENSINQQTQVVILTANAVSGAKERYLENGFSDYLSKPVTGKELEKMILKFLPEDIVEETTKNE